MATDGTTSDSGTRRESRTPPPPDELGLVESAQRGDRGAFDELVRRYHERVQAVALGMVSDPDQALDVTQEAFAKAYQSLASFGGRSNFYTWLYRITINAAIDHLRRERREPTLDYDDGLRVDHAATGREHQDHLESPEGMLRRRELEGAIFEAIDALPAEQRAAILLREVEGLSYKEIASVMRCSQGTVMSRLHYARQKLKKRLGGAV